MIQIQKNVLEFLTLRISQNACHFTGSSGNTVGVAVLTLVKYEKWVELSWLLDESQCLPTYLYLAHCSGCLS
jgi:hypothetical protein